MQPLRRHEQHLVVKMTRAIRPTNVSRMTSKRSFLISAVSQNMMKARQDPTNQSVYCKDDDEGHRYSPKRDKDIR